MYTDPGSSIYTKTDAYFLQTYLAKSITIWAFFQPRFNLSCSFLSHFGLNFVVRPLSDLGVGMLHSQIENQCNNTLLFTT